LLAGDSGLDPYTREVSDVYQDVFGEGSFIGKGIYDVDAFRQAVDGRFPENLILSHDLLESGYARSALVTDVDLIEEQPASIATESSRRHRWIRGDWQLVGWLLPRVPGPPNVNGVRSKRQANPLSALSLWKIFDNLRRSLVAPALLALLVGGWLVGSSPLWVWTLLVVAVVFLPPLLSTLIELIRKPEESDWLLHLSLTGRSSVRPIALALLTLAFCPMTRGLSWERSGAREHACRSHDAACCCGNCPATQAAMHAGHWLIFPGDVGCAGSRGGGGVALVMVGSTLVAGLVAAPILLLWLLSPVVGWWISQPLVAPSPGLSVEQQVFLRAAARRTWRYFADFLGPDDNWLPPDNFQIYPAPAIASRTSPTNIGMSLLADLAAVDFGYLTVGECLQRIGNTLTTMEKLERYRGHFTTGTTPKRCKRSTPICLFGGQR